MNADIENETFKIVKIIDPYSVVINGGANFYIHKGDKLEIFEKGKEVIDPETKESLGTLDFVKAYIQVTDVFPKMSVCKNIVRYENRIAASLSSALAPTVKAEELQVDSMDISGGYEDIDKKIKVGDLVRESL